MNTHDPVFDAWWHSQKTIDALECNDHSIQEICKIAWEGAVAAERARCAQLCRDKMPSEGIIRRTLLDLEREILDA